MSTLSDTRSFFAGIVVGFLALSFVSDASAFEGFDDGGGGGVPACASCHGALADEGPQHDTHAALANGCGDCHSGFNNPPLSNCVQCHGRAEDAGNDGGMPGLGRGLRLHHVTMGAAACGTCHGDVQSAAPVAGENVAPSFYAGTNLDSCDGSEEIFASLTISLDNDGDGLTDGNDPDCASNLPPTANPNGPYNAVLGSSITFDSSGSTDSDGTIVSYAWDFGDGNVSTQENPSHIYAAAGTYTVTLTVTDDAGDTSSDATTATIEAVVVNTPPTADANGPYSAFVGDAVTFDGSGSTDSDGAIVTYDWDFGDGSAQLNAGPEPMHTYSTAGQYTVTLTVTDDAGESDRATAAVDILERAAASDGESQYNSYCASCHGSPWAESVVDDALPGAHRVPGARACSIDASIFGTSVFPDGAPGMQFLQDLVNNGSIDAEQLAEYLNSEPTNGEQRYVTACAGCHGSDAQGGRTHEGVLGESAHDIREAIDEESTMRFLACLPDSDIDAIAEFLGGGDSDSDTDHVIEDNPGSNSASGGGGAFGSMLLLMFAAFGLRRFVAPSPANQERN